jgi:hypothetical protein
MTNARLRHLTARRRPPWTDGGAPTPPVIHYRCSRASELKLIGSIATWKEMVVGPLPYPHWKVAEVTDHGAGRTEGFVEARRRIPSRPRPCLCSGDLTRERRSRISKQPTCLRRDPVKRANLTSADPELPCCLLPQCQAGLPTTRCSPELVDGGKGVAELRLLCTTVKSEQNQEDGAEVVGDELAPTEPWWRRSISPPPRTSSGCATTARGDCARLFTVWEL